MANNFTWSILRGGGIGGGVSGGDGTDWELGGVGIIESTCEPAADEDNTWRGIDSTGEALPPSSLKETLLLTSRGVEEGDIKVTPLL